MNFHHNIARSEAFRTGPAVIVRELPRRRKRLAPAGVYLISAVAAVACGLVDVVLQQPVCLALACSVFLVLWLRG